MDERSDLQLQAESLFAALLVDDPQPSAERLRALCESHPELAPELERMHQHLAMMRAVLPDALPSGRFSWSASSAPPHLGAFRCVRLLGRGGMGEVWEAQDLTLGRTVAVKLLRDPWKATDTQLQRFQREAQAASRVLHPGIVAVHQTGDWEGRPYIVQELVPGGRTLRDEIDELHRLPELPADHARIVAARFRAIADALAAAHAQGIVHRDLKPQNVLLSPRGEPKVADFGLALLTSDESLSRTGEFLGTCFYASPEQIEGRTLDERSDVFSLAATLYENLTLRRAFDGDSIRQVMRAVTETDPPAPHLLRGRVPRDLSLIVMKALEKRPEHRYRSMIELRDELERFLRNVPIRARAPSAPQRVWKWSQRHPTVATALALSIGSSLALATLFVRSERARDDATRAEAETSKVNASLVETSDDLRVQKTVAEEVTEFLLGMFQQASPDVSGDRVPTLREILDRAVRRLESGEVQDPVVRGRLQGVLGGVFQSLGDPETSRGLLESSLAAAQGREIDTTEVELCLIQALASTNQEREAEERVAGMLARIGQDADFDRKYATRIHMVHASVLQHQGRPVEVAQALERAQEQVRLHPPDPDMEVELRLDVAVSLLGMGQLDEARGRLEELGGETEELRARADPTALRAVTLLGMVAIQQGRLDEAEQLFLEVCDEILRSLDPDHPDVLMLQMNLGRVWEAQRRYAEAEQHYRQLLPTFEQTYGKMDVATIALSNNIATCALRLGRVDEAEELLAEMCDRSTAVYGEEHELTLGRQHNLAQVLQVQGRHEEALALQERVVEHTPADHPLAGSRRQQLETLRKLAGAER